MPSRTLSYLRLCFWFCSFPFLLLSRLIFTLVGIIFVQVEKTGARFLPTRSSITPIYSHAISSSKSLSEVRLFDDQRRQNGAQETWEKCCRKDSYRPTQGEPLEKNLTAATGMCPRSTLEVEWEPQNYSVTRLRLVPMPETGHL